MIVQCETTMVLSLRTIQLTVSLAIALLLAWVWSSGRGGHRQWESKAFLEVHTQPLEEEESAAHRAELGALLKAADMQGLQSVEPSVPRMH